MSGGLRLRPGPIIAGNIRYLITGSSIGIANSEKIPVRHENGHVPMDNNAAENAIRPFVVGKKNWLFSGHPTGARAGSCLYSLIETAKACGLKPYDYLRYLFDNIPFAETEAEHEAFLPQNLTPAQIENFSSRCA